MKRARIAIAEGWGFGERLAAYVFRRDPLDLKQESEVLGDEGWKEAPAGECAAPTVFLDEDAARRLMDGLWSKGVRPSDWGSEGLERALRDHLADMRRLVAAKLEVPLP